MLTLGLVVDCERLSSPDLVAVILYFIALNLLSALNLFDLSLAVPVEDAYFHLLNLVVGRNRCKLVVDLAVHNLVCPHGQDDLSESRAFGKSPVPNRELRGLLVLPVGQFSLVYLLQAVCLGANGLFFEVADEAVRGSGGQGVEEGVLGHKDQLAAQDGHPWRIARGCRSR